MPTSPRLPKRSRDRSPRRRTTCNPCPCRNCTRPRPRGSRSGCLSNHARAGLALGCPHGCLRGTRSRRWSARFVSWQLSCLVAADQDLSGSIVPGLGPTSHLRAVASKQSHVPGQREAGAWHYEGSRGAGLQLADRMGHNLPVHLHGQWRSVEVVNHQRERGRPGRLGGGRPWTATGEADQEQQGCCRGQGSNTDLRQSHQSPRLRYRGKPTPACRLSRLIGTFCRRDVVGAAPERPRGGSTGRPAVQCRPSADDVETTVSPPGATWSMAARKPT
jgi:hypothetical protein